MERNERKMLTMKKKRSSITAKVKKCATNVFHFIWQERQDYLVIPHGAKFVQQKNINARSLKDATNAYQFTAMYEAQIPFQPWLSASVQACQWSMFKTRK